MADDFDYSADINYDVTLNDGDYSGGYDVPDIWDTTPGIDWSQIPSDYTITEDGNTTFNMFEDQTYNDLLQETASGWDLSKIARGVWDWLKDPKNFRLAAAGIGGVASFLEANGAKKAPTTGQSIKQTVADARAAYSPYWNAVKNARPSDKMRVDATGKFIPPVNARNGGLIHFDESKYIPKFADGGAVDTGRYLDNFTNYAGTNVGLTYKRTDSAGNYIYEDSAGRTRRFSPDGTKSWVKSGSSWVASTDGWSTSSTIPSDFDWQQYINNYGDLRQGGIDTYQEALDHWLANGTTESRSYAPIAGAMDANAQIGDLYNSILHRTASPEEIANWAGAFGTTVTPDEVTTFRNSAAPELATHAGTYWDSVTNGWMSPNDKLAAIGYGVDIGGAVAPAGSDKAAILQHQVGPGQVMLENGSVISALNLNSNPDAMFDPNYSPVRTITGQTIFVPTESISGFTREMPDINTAFNETLTANQPWSSVILPNGAVVNPLELSGNADAASDPHYKAITDIYGNTIYLPTERADELSSLSTEDVLGKNIDLTGQVILTPDPDLDSDGGGGGNTHVDANGDGYYDDDGAPLPGWVQGATWDGSKWVPPVDAGGGNTHVDANGDGLYDDDGTPVTGWGDDKGKVWDAYLNKWIDSVDFVRFDRPVNPYQGDITRYGRSGGGGEHQFFNITNPLPDYTGNPFDSAVTGANQPMDKWHAGKPTTYTDPRQTYDNLGTAIQNEGRYVPPATNTGDAPLTWNDNPPIYQRPTNLVAPWVPDNAYIPPEYASGGRVAGRHYLGAPMQIGQALATGAVNGAGTGQSDHINARLSDGEYVIDADTVAALGDGSTRAGAKALDAMRVQIRKHKRAAPASKIPPRAKSPLDYMKGHK